MPTPMAIGRDMKKKSLEERVLDLGSDISSFEKVVDGLDPKAISEEPSEPSPFFRQWKLPDWVKNIAHEIILIDAEGRGFVTDHKGELVRVR